MMVLRELIGEGGSARVHAAQWRGRDVCVKVGDESLLAEADAARRVTHPALAPVLDAGHLPDGRAYLVMPRIAGEDLATRLARGALAVDEAVAIAHAVGGALSALHAAELLHRDVKPANVMLGPDGPVLIDLEPAPMRGTHDHVAPERLFGEPATIASEVYELAVLVWTMIAGRLPWPSGAGPSARRGIPELGIAPLDAVLARALSTIPERRPASIAALIAELEATRGAAPRVERKTASLRADVSRAPLSVTVGAVLADTYRLTAILGTGGSGTVFAAEHLRLPRRFAIKVLADRDDDARARFRREAELIARLADPRIVEVFDYDIDDTGVPFMVMRLLEGETLRDRLRRGPLSPADAVELVAQTARAIEVAHAAGVVHRDLKPSNVFLTGGDIDVTVLDFGISKLIDHGDRTQTGGLLGTPGYAAPEQITGDPIGPAADVFALAAIAYEALSGTRAFDGPTRDATLYRICHAEPAPLASRAIDRVVRGALAKQAARRPATPSAFAAALAAAIARPPRRIPLAAASALALAVVLVVTALPGTRTADTRSADSRSADTHGADRGSADSRSTDTGSAPAITEPRAEHRTRNTETNGHRAATAASAARRRTAAAHTIRLVLEPPTARATLDGARVGDTIELAAGQHELVVRAPGHATVTRTLDATTAAGELHIALPTDLRTLLEH